MNICHVISSIDVSSGGTSSYEQLLINNLQKSIDITLITIESKNALPINSKVKTIFVECTFPFLQAYTKHIQPILENDNFNVFHGNGLWQYPVHKMATIARNKKRPYIISPHGMLRPWALERSRLKKQIALKLYQKKDLVNAACLHATSQIEAIDMKELGFKNPIAVIPNGIDLSEYPIQLRKSKSSQKTILYLSRIFPKKGLEDLIEAWSMVEKTSRKDWQINIVGNGDEKYITELKFLISKNKLENEIKFIGAKFGKEKIEAFHSASLFVLPTHGENFGMAIAEALACGLPVITTKGAPWQELQIYNAGWWIDIGAEPLASALTEAMKLSDNERMQMGLNGRKLVEEKYSIEIIAKKMIELYEWILGKRIKPEFII